MAIGPLKSTHQWRYSRMKNNMIEQDINRIRLEIYETTKGMTPEQRVEHTHKATDETIKKYGFKVVEKIPQTVNA